MKASRLFVPAIAGATVAVCVHAQAQCPNQAVREPAAWVMTEGNSISAGNVRAKITINRTLKEDQDGTEQHVVLSSATDGGLYYQYRESQSDCLKVSDGFGTYDYVPSTWEFDASPGPIVSRPFTQDFDLEAAYEAEDTSGAEAIYLFRYLYEGGQHRVAYKYRGHGPAGTWTPSSATSHSYFHSSSSTIKDIELTIDRAYDNTPVAVWLEQYSGDYRVRWQSGTSGTPEWLSASGTEAMTPRIASFTDGTIYVAWVEDQNGDVAYKMRVFGSFAGQARAWWPPLNQGAYQFETSTWMDETVGPMSIAVGPDGRLHVVYIDDASGDHDMMYRNFLFTPNPGNPSQPGTFSAQESIAPAEWSVWATDVAVDSYGSVHVAYEYHSNGTKLGYRIRENGAWSALHQLAVQENMRPSICLDAEENLHVVAGTNNAEIDFESAIKRVWTKEAGGGVESGPGQWITISAFDMWSGTGRNGGTTWNVSENQPYDFTATMGSNDIHESSWLYWFWTRTGQSGTWDDVYWHARIRVPGEKAVLFDYLAGNTGNIVDRWEFQARLLDNLPADGLGRVAASSVLGNRFPASSTIQSPLSGNPGEGPTYRGLEYYNSDSDAHYVAPSFRHQIMTSVTGDNSGQVTFNRLWWRMREQGTLQSAKMAITSMSPTLLTLGSGNVNVTLTGTGFDPAAAFVEMNHQAVPIISRSATQLVFQVNTNTGPGEGIYPVVAINPTSGVFEMVNGALVIEP